MANTTPFFMLITSLVALSTVIDHCSGITQATTINNPNIHCQAGNLTTAGDDFQDATVPQSSSSSWLKVAPSLQKGTSVKAFNIGTKMTDHQEDHSIDSTSEEAEAYQGWVKKREATRDGLESFIFLITLHGYAVTFFISLFVLARRLRWIRI